MSIAHQYGAIKTVQEIEALLAKAQREVVFVYEVYDFGGEVAAIRLTPASFLEYKDLSHNSTGTYVSPFVRDVMYVDRNWTSDFSLNDRNIGGGGYNNHALFTNEEDAYEYRSFVRNDPTMLAIIAERDARNREWDTYHDFYDDHDDDYWEREED